MEVLRGEMSQEKRLPSGAWRSERLPTLNSVLFLPRRAAYKLVSGDSGNREH